MSEPSTSVKQLSRAWRAQWPCLEALRPHEIFRVWASFDTEYYTAVYDDVRTAKVDPFEHFMLHGWREGRNPSRKFSTAYYLEHSPDIRNSGVNPFVHWVLAGKAEGRRALAETPKRLTGLEGLSQDQVASIRSAFDAEYYLERYDDVRDAGIDPLEHFLQHGWREDRDPSPEFSTSFYLANAPDVRAAEMNPLIHWVLAGKAEGRITKNRASHTLDFLSRQRPFEETIKNCAHLESPAVLCSVADIVSGILERRAPESRHLVISIGHDDYAQNYGGVQLCIRREEQLAATRGVTYLNLHPWRPTSSLAQDHGGLLLRARMDGEEIGVAKAAEIEKAASELKAHFARSDFAIHHMMGHSPEFLLDLIKVMGNSYCVFWLHDFFSICPSYSLQRNNITFCGAPPSNSNSCGICIFGGTRIDHEKRIKHFFESIETEVIAPSEVALEFWQTHSDLIPKSTRIVPHTRLSKAQREVAELPKQHAAIRVAFVGVFAPHKGSLVFEKLYRRLNDDPRYEFFYFGITPPPFSKVKLTEVAVSAAAPNAMIEAIDREGIDIVVHWTSCFETFSFSTIEALSANASVVTNVNSGNVASLVETTGQGLVLNTEEELITFFEGDGAQALTKKHRQRTERFSRSLALSDMSFTVLSEKVSPG